MPLILLLYLPVLPGASGLIKTREIKDLNCLVPHLAEAVCITSFANFLEVEKYIGVNLKYIGKSWKVCFA